MSKTLSPHQIAHLARLSNLTLNETEKEKIANQFTQTLDYIKNLDELDLSAVDAAHHLSGKQNIFFEDGTDNARHVDVAELDHTQESDGSRYFVVKKIL